MTRENEIPIAARVNPSATARVSANLPPGSNSPGVPSDPSPEQMAELQRVGEAYRKIRRAAGVAMFSGGTTLGIGLLAILCVGFSPSASGILIAALLCGFGAVELIGRHRLLRGDATAIPILMWNQIVFLVMIVLYCVLHIATASTNGMISSEVQQMVSQSPDISGSIQSLQDLLVPLERLLYGTVAVVSVFSQGGLALYYSRRRRFVEVFRSASAWQKRLLLHLAA